MKKIAITFALITLILTGCSSVAPVENETTWSITDNDCLSTPTGLMVTLPRLEEGEYSIIASDESSCYVRSSNAIYHYSSSQGLFTYTLEQPSNLQ